MSEASRKTAGQREREISQHINALYRSELDHQPGKITAQLFENKLVLVIENAITKPEQLLLEQGKSEIAEQANQEISETFKAKASQIVEGVLDVKVVDILLDSNLESGLSSVVVVFEEPPEVKNPSAIPKYPKD